MNYFDASTTTARMRKHDRQHMDLRDKPDQKALEAVRCDRTATRAERATLMPTLVAIGSRDAVEAEASTRNGCCNVAKESHSNGLLKPDQSTMCLRRTDTSAMTVFHTAMTHSQCELNCCQDQVDFCQTKSHVSCDVFDTPLFQFFSGV